MKISFEEIEIGQKFSGEEQDVYREFVKVNSVTATDEVGDEWLFMNLVDKFYEVLE